MSKRKDAFKVHSEAAGKRSRQRKQKPGDDLVVIRVDRRIWETAVKAAGGDPRRIRIISKTRVEIDPPRK